MQDVVDISWFRAFKIWWSYSWRAFVLCLLVLIPVEIVMFAYMKSHLLPGPGAPHDPTAALGVARMMAVVWPIVMAVMIALQAQAMRWTLNKARWSDFRIAVMPSEQ